MEPNSRSDTIDQVVYNSLKEDLFKKQHVDAVISFYNEITGKVEYTASCHKIAMAAKSKLMHQLLSSHDGPDDEKVHVVLVDSIDRGKAVQLIELMYDHEKTDKDIALLWDIEGAEEERMDYMIEPETILQADEIKKEPLESDSDPLGPDNSAERAGGRVVCVAPGKFFGDYRCEPGRKKTPQAREVLERMSASEKCDFRPVEDSMDKVFCLLCEKTLRISTTGVIKQHCNTATHKKKKEEAMAETRLSVDDIKKEIPEVSSEDQPGNLGQNSYAKPKQNANVGFNVGKKVKTLEEVLLDVNILENFALKTVANSKDKIYCQICAITLIVNRPIDIKAHCKTAEHVLKKIKGKTTYSNQQMYDRMINELVGGAQNATGKRKTLQDTLDEINVQENGALSAVEGTKDKIFCTYCERTLTIGNLSDIKRHCNSSKHLQGKISPHGRANSKRAADQQYLFNDELCDELCPSYNARPYKRKTFEEVIEELNVQEEGAFSIVGDSKDEVHCSLCEKDFKVQQLASLKQHCRTNRHATRREAKKRKKMEEEHEATAETCLRADDIKTEKPEVRSEDTGESKEEEEEEEDETLSDATAEQRSPETLRLKSLGDVLTEINADENGAFQLVENERDKIFCRICDQTLTIWQRSDIKRHCKLAKHLKNREREQEKRRKERWIEWKEGIKVLPKGEGKTEDGKRLQTDAEEGSFTCPYCEHGFSLSNPCKQHILKVHGVEVPKGMSIQQFRETVSKDAEVIKKSAKRQKCS